jgi:hypothetical protein
MVMSLQELVVPDSNGVGVVSVPLPRGNHSVSHWIAGLVVSTVIPVAQENLLRLSKVETHVQ